MRVAQRGKLFVVPLSSIIESSSIIIFTSPSVWNKKVVAFERGVWVRLYRIPLHASNEKLFKLCVFECGRFLRTDIQMPDKERFDYYECILLATSSLEVTNVVDKIMVDEFCWR